jgi:hypothetical protein
MNSSVHRVLHYQNSTLVPEVRAIKSNNGTPFDPYYSSLVWMYLGTF